MYLLHILVLNAIKLIPIQNHLLVSPISDELTLFLMTTLFTLWIAKLSFYFFELYFLELKSRFKR